MSAPPVVFVHVPKTGGMTLTAILRRQYGDAVLELRGPLADAVRDVGALSAERRDHVRAAHGHLPFGIHRVFPAGCRYVTLVRDPVDRLVSVYHYALRRPEWALHREIVEHGWSLDAFAESASAHEFHEQQTRMLNGLELRAAESGTVAAALRAIDEHFVLAGPTERFDDFVALAARRLGWTRVRYRPANVNRRRPPLDEIPRSTRARLERANPKDAELHAAVTARFAARLREAPLLEPDPPRLAWWRAAWSRAAKRLR